MSIEKLKQFGFRIYLTEKNQLEAVKQDGCSIKYIENPSEEIQLAAVKENGYSIQYIENPTEEVQLEAVKKYGLSLEYIQNPSETVQLEAVKQNGFYIQYIKNPSEEVILYYIIHYNDYSILNPKNFSEELIDKIIEILNIKDVLEN